MYRLSKVLMAAAWLLAACASGDRPPVAPVPATPARELSDAAHGGTAGFFFLPPITKAPTVSGAFDPGLVPEVRVCEWSGTTCTATVAHYTTTTGPGGELVRLHEDEEHYAANFHTGDFALTSGAIYRIAILASGVTLGYADLQVGSMRELRNAVTNEYVPLIDGRTLPIKFRIETGIAASVDVTPASATVMVGETQVFAATVRDLHGVTLALPVTWTSSNSAVATVTGGGVAVAATAGSTTITAVAGGRSASAALTVLPAGQAYARISAGDEHTCAVTASGAGYCWGQGSLGQLGTGGTSASFRPTAVAGGQSWSSIEVGNRHSCGVTTSGSALCWGWNLFGAVGAGVALNGLPVLSPTTLPGGITFTSLDGGNFSTCGVDVALSAWCWGLNDIGQGGIGTTSPSSIQQPMPVVGGLSFVTVTTGIQTACGIDTSARAWCWGSGSYGKLGNGSSPPISTVPVPVSGSTSFSQVSSSGYHVCALNTTGGALCWGRNQLGQLGDNAPGVDQSVPVAVAGGLVFSSISTGREHTCAIASGGAAYCWGRNDRGQLGDGTTVDRAVPVPVATSLRFSRISAGSDYTCALTLTGAPWCWGANNGGQLGDGSIGADRLLPVSVLDP